VSFYTFALLGLGYGGSVWNVCEDIMEGEEVKEVKEVRRKKLDVEGV
jgi:hypothetical protein